MFDERRVAACADILEDRCDGGIDVGRNFGFASRKRANAAAKPGGWESSSSGIGRLAETLDPGPTSSARVFSAARLTMKREVYRGGARSRPARSRAGAPGRDEVDDLTRRSMLGANSIAPFSTMHSAWTPRCAKYRRVTSGPRSRCAHGSSAKDRRVRHPPWARRPRAGSDQFSSRAGHRCRDSRTPSARHCRRRRAAPRQKATKVATSKLRTRMTSSPSWLVLKRNCRESGSSKARSISMPARFKSGATSPNMRPGAAPMPASRCRARKFAPRIAGRLSPIPRPDARPPPRRPRLAEII